MSNLQNRVNKLEKDSGTGQRMKYMCVHGSEYGTPEQRAKGYEIRPEGGEPFYLATREELDAFAARPDVDLTTIEVEYVRLDDLGEAQPITTITDGDYSVRVGIDWDKL